MSNRGIRGLVTVALLVAVFGVTVAAQTQSSVRGRWTRGLTGGWGHTWRYGVPGYDKTTSDVAQVTFYPQLGRFVTSQLELYGEGTLLVHYRPTIEVSGGVTGVGGRYHLRAAHGWVPYIVGGAGLIWTSLDVPEIDRVFNFQLHYGLGIRWIPPSGPGWMLELRNHHISNAGTAGENLGLNAATIIVGIQWILRDRARPGPSATQ